MRGCWLVCWLVGWLVGELVCKLGVGGYILNLILAHVVPMRLESVAQRDHGLLVSRSLQNATSVH